jgi:hypothetical protein
MQRLSRTVGQTDFPAANQAKTRYLHIFIPIPQAANLKTQKHYHKYIWTKQIGKITPI